MRVSCFLLSVGILGLFSSISLQAQTRNLNQNQIQNQNQTQGSVSGQTGQSENFMIQRDPTAFIGGAATSFFNNQGVAGGMGPGGIGGMGGIGGLGGLGGFGRGNTGFGNQMNTQNEAEPQIRFRITLGFSHPRPVGSKVSADFARRLTRIPNLASTKAVTVTMEDRTAVLVGEVETDHEKRQIEKLAMLEPGISAVRNELTVTATSAPLPPPTVSN